MSIDADVTPAAGQQETTEKLRVSVEVFDGPLDLLLSLVKERQLDIATVPLATVAEQYLAYVSMMEDLNVEIAAEYLVIAATLVFLKSKALLPPIPSEFQDEEAETPEQVEERLRQRLIAYSKYREVGEELRARQLEASSFYYRDTGDPVSELRQRYRVDPDKLTRAFIAMLRSARPEKRTIARERLSLMASMDYIMRKVRENGEVLFSSLCKELGMTRDSIIVTFLAVLELIRRHRVTVDQPEPFDDIRVLPIAAPVSN
ncbi:MAG TPA: segregation/condensation protein A [Candidatus Baltobacteraceae bacterium]|nr:segregation/condensation protein A [Candidatus Baltobacteraceae bacterium]